MVKQSSLDEESSVAVSLAAEVKGSPLYMSPEQAEAPDTIDARADIYSLGVTAYGLLSGVVPFRGKRRMQVLIAHARDEPEPPSLHESSIPKDLENVVLRCLAKKPEERFADVRALDAALANCVDAGNWSENDAAEWWNASRSKVRSA